MTLIERLQALAIRREDEGIYTDTNICTLAVKEIKTLRATVEDLTRALENALEAVEATRMQHLNRSPEWVSGYRQGAMNVGACFSMEARAALARARKETP